MLVAIKGGRSNGSRHSKMVADAQSRLTVGVRCWDLL